MSRHIGAFLGRFGSPSGTFEWSVTTSVRTFLYSDGNSSDRSICAASGLFLGADSGSVNYQKSRRSRNHARLSYEHSQPRVGAWFSARKHCCLRSRRATSKLLRWTCGRRLKPAPGRTSRTPASGTTGFTFQSPWARPWTRFARPNTKHIEDGACVAAQGVVPILLGRDGRGRRASVL